MLFCRGPRVVYSTNELLFATNKVVPPARMYYLPESSEWRPINQCDFKSSRYVGRTSQSLQNRIKQHVPKSIHSCSSSQKSLLPAWRCKSSTQTNTQSPASDSVIGLHILQHPVCAQHYDDSRVSILVQGRFPYHLQYLLLKPLSSNFPIPPSADKKNSWTA